MRDDERVQQVREIVTGFQSREVVVAQGSFRDVFVSMGTTGSSTANYGQALLIIASLRVLDLLDSSPYPSPSSSYSC